MSSVLVCCIALLHALVLATTSLAVRSDVVGASQLSYESNSAQWTAATLLLPEETIRVPLRAAVAVSLRAARWLPIGKAGASQPVERAEKFALGTSTEQALLECGTEMHRVASRGTVLPYFPTAPPRSA